MHRASPPRQVPDFEKVEVAAAEALSGATWVNLEASHVTHDEGFAYPVYAILPDKAEYDKVRFSFGPVTLADISDATIQVWARGSDKEPYLLGEVDLTASGAFPAIEAENYQAEYACIVSSITEDGQAPEPELSVKVFVQGLFETLAVAG